MSASHAHRLSAGLRSVLAAHTERVGTGRYRATVTAWNDQTDFELDVHGLDLTLDAQDVNLGQTVRGYDAITPIDVGDALILVQVGEGDYVAVEVESEET